jgi:hypothetical protein
MRRWHKATLGWEANTHFRDLVALMREHDLQEAGIPGLPVAG